MIHERGCVAWKKIFIYCIALPVVPLVLYFAYHILLFSSSVFTVIEGKVYRSGQLSGDILERTMKEKGVKSILNLTGKATDRAWHIRENEIAIKYGAKLYDIGLTADELPKYLDLINILNIIQTSEKPILIHCRRGSDRSGMVSALALAIENDPPLSELKKQFSFRYGVFPFYRSIGPYFFSKYEQWLDSAKKAHSKDILLYWINHEYHDNYRNQEFWIDQINDTNCKDSKFFKDRKVRIPDDAKYIIIKGWAFDAVKGVPTNNLSVAVDGRISSKANFIVNRPDVAKSFNLGEQYYQNFIIGWEAELSRQYIPSGCHNISLKFNDDNTIWDIPTGNNFCL